MAAGLVRVKGYFRWLEQVLQDARARSLSRYRAYTTCADCHGQRLNPDALLYRCAIPRSECSSGAVERGGGNAGTSALGDQPSFISLADFYALPVDRALAAIEQLADRHSLQPRDPLLLVLNEVRTRLQYLVEVGLGYLTLDRPTRTLSGGETERVNLTTCLGTRLVNTLFVLDEPSVGLHPRDTARLVRILEQLRDTGNTVVVVEHESNVIRAADHIVDLGPGQGEKGGEVVFQGPVTELLRSEASLTGQYLSRRRQIEAQRRRPVNQGHEARRSKISEDVSALAATFVLNEAVVPYAESRNAGPALKICNASRHNLKNLTIEIPLGRFVCLTGVSGSGKTTLVRDVLLPALQESWKPRRRRQGL
jgi:excinuclease ABC subunit A